ncbi:protein of unknown function [Clostridium amylolyticum]|uniref:DUF2935 domain-containing protein n=1 Tax=Clostridium amylolyticum TaxID=1121298 RepID=A0A1M6HEB9_9CLOT|nr:DUF2935 domain-containing protein [Clostridium amylolyticum]SHJ20494.1 protein of unknown function [Clostridium amylolyticum]
MLSNAEFIRQSLELHLFFARIMKEHSFFLQVGFPQKNSNFILQADAFRKEFDNFLLEVIRLSQGIVSENVLHSGEVVTPYTLKAEMALVENRWRMDKVNMEQSVFIINQKAMELIKALMHFKSVVISQVNSCTIITTNYPSLLMHILEEAKHYLLDVQRLQMREEVTVHTEPIKEEDFWNDIMGEHAKFIRGMLDPSEEELIKIANNLANKFDALKKESSSIMDKVVATTKLLEDSIKATMEIIKFKQQGTEGILNCKIKSLIIPLLADHTLREANHYMRVLKSF